MNERPEQTEPSLEKVRDGVVRLQRAGIALLDLEGNNILVQYKCIDLLLDSSLERFNALIQRIDYDPTLVAHVLADSQVEGWGEDTRLYLKSIVQGAEGLEKYYKKHYVDLSDSQKSKLIGYIYRKPQERRLPTYIQTYWLYPDWNEQVPEGTKKVDWLLNVDPEGLQSVLRNKLETDTLQSYDQDELKRIWQKRGWTDYLLNAAKLGECRVSKPDGISTFTVAPFNHPIAIGVIAGDVMSVQGIELDVKQLVAYMQEIFPHREKLQDSDYFDKDMPSEDRHILLRKIFQGIPLL